MAADDETKPEVEAAKAEPEESAKNEATDDDEAEEKSEDKVEIAPEPKKKKKKEIKQDPVEMARRWKIFGVLFVVSLIADQATKLWARASLPVVGHGTDNGTCVIPDDIKAQVCAGKPVGVIDSFMHWRLSMNPGSAFGLFSSGGAAARVGLSIVGILAVLGMISMLRKARADQKILHWALALVASGAVGNLIDRIYYGVVTDFILWHTGEKKTDLTWDHEWPVFNVADIVLVVGVGFMVIDMYREWQRDRKKRARRKAKAKAAGLTT